MLARIQALLLLRSRAETGVLSRADIAAIRQRMVGLAGPSLVENLSYSALSMVNMMMVGRLGADAVAGVGLGSRIRMLFMLVFSGMAVGNTALVARFIGAKDSPAAARVAKQSLSLGVFLTIATTLIGFFFPYQLVAWMGAEYQTNLLAASYIRVIALGQLFQMVMAIGNGTLRGAGDTRTPMLTSMVINLINVVVGYALILGKLGFPALGVEGAAIGLVASQAVGSALVLGVLVRGRPGIRLDWRGSWRFDWKLIARLFRIGWPATLESLFMQLGMFAYLIIVVSLGTEVFATQQIILNVTMFVFMPGEAFSVAATTMVAQSLGAKNPARAERSGWEAARLAVAWTTLVGVLFFFIGRPIIGLYIADPDITSLGALCLRIFSLSFPLMALNQSLGGALRGAGDTRFPMLLTGSSVWLVRLPAVYLLGITLGYGLPGVWVGHGLDLAFRGALMAWRFRRGKWKAMRV